jgi:hypothetical protein
VSSLPFYFSWKSSENDDAVERWWDEHRQGKKGEGAAWGSGLAVEFFLLVAATATVIVMEAGTCRIELADKQDEGVARFTLPLACADASRISRRRKVTAGGLSSHDFSCFFSLSLTLVMADEEVGEAAAKKETHATARPDGAAAAGDVLVEARHDSDQQAGFEP